MKTILLIAVLGQWNYNNFIGDPKPASDTSPAVVKPTPTLPSVTSPSVPSPIVHSTPPQTWYLRDMDGRQWDSTDRDWLWTYVYARNQVIAEMRKKSQTQAQPQAQYDASYSYIQRPTYTYFLNQGQQFTGSQTQCINGTCYSIPAY